MKSYQSYKDSGVEWIGEIPSGWELSRVKYLLKDDRFRSGPFGSSLITNRLVESGHYLVYTPEHLTNKIIEYPLYVPFEREDELKKYEIRDGDIVLPIVGTLGRGKLFILEDENGILNQRLCRITPDTNKVVSKYLLNFLTNTNLVNIQFDIEKKGSILDHITREIIFNLQLPLPTFSEQIQIVEYLDDKTQKIDELIEKTEKKIELLKEKRTSLINHCVTKGLNPNGEMKDSGVEWIGEIPNRWTISKLKYNTLIPVRYGLNISSDRYTEEGVRFIRITDLDDWGVLNPDNGKYLVESDVNEEFLLDKYDLLFCRSGHTVGKSYLHLQDGKYSSGGYLVRFNFGNYFSSKFLFYVTKTDFYWYWIRLNIITSTIENVNGEKYSNMEYPKPTIEEQQQIVEYLDEQTQEIDTTIEKETQRIELLKEYRQSLISEVVTGKIDVRKENY